MESTSLAENGGRCYGMRAWFGFGRVLLIGPPRGLEELMSIIVIDLASQARDARV